ILYDYGHRGPQSADREPRGPVQRAHRDSSAAERIRVERSRRGPDIVVRMGSRRRQLGHRGDSQPHVHGSGELYREPHGHGQRLAALSRTAFTSASITNFIAVTIVRNHPDAILKTTGNRQELFGMESSSWPLTD